MARTLIISNLINERIGVAGRVLKPNVNLSLDLQEIQQSDTYAAELSNHKANGKVSVGLDGQLLTATEIANLSAPKSADLLLKSENFVNPAAADVNAIVTAITMAAAGLSLSGDSLDGVVGGGVMNPPRNITITTTTGSGEAIEGGDAVVTGIDIAGHVRSETITIAALGASTSQVDTGAICFTQVTSVVLPTDASGSPGDAEVGFGTIMGLSAPLSRGGLLGEFVDNAVPGTAGTIVLSGTSAPNGTYNPNTAPNGAHDYVLEYLSK